MERLCAIKCCTVMNSASSKIQVKTKGFEFELRFNIAVNNLSVMS